VLIGDSFMQVQVAQVHAGGARCRFRFVKSALSHAAAKIHGLYST